MEPVAKPFTDRQVVSKGEYAIGAEYRSNESKDQSPGDFIRLTH